MFLANMHENFQENQQELKALKTWDRVLTTYCDLMFQSTKCMAPKFNFIYCLVI